MNAIISILLSATILISGISLRPPQTIDKMEMTKVNYSLLCNMEESDFELFAAIVNAEDGVDDYDNQVAIACVIFNRVDSSDFPDTVCGVITEKGQFSTYKNGGPVEWNGETAYPNDSCRRAIYDAYINRPLPINVLYFRASYYFSGLEQYDHIGDNYFSYG